MYAIIQYVVLLAVHLLVNSHFFVNIIFLICHCIILRMFPRSASEPIPFRMTEKIIWKGLIGKLITGWQVWTVLVTCASSFAQVIMLCRFSRFVFSRRVDLWPLMLRIYSLNDLVVYCSRIILDSLHRIRTTNVIDLALSVPVKGMA